MDYFFLVPDTLTHVLVLVSETECLSVNAHMHTHPRASGPSCEAGPQGHATKGFLCAY